MLYIHQSSCISPQSTFEPVDIDGLRLSVNNQLPALEPVYTGIPPAALRRMGRSVKLSVGAAMPLLAGAGTPDAPGSRPAPGAIIIGTGNGGLGDCVQFLTQLIEYDEGMLTPGHFVQSTSNAMAAQISLVTANRSYNSTHVHRGLAFEMALLDAALHASEAPERVCLLGAVDEISSPNVHIETLAGAYKDAVVSNADLYTTETPGTLAGEGAAMFLTSGQAEGALASVSVMETLHSTDPAEVASLAPEADLLLSGENGDSRVQPFYAAVESRLPAAGIARFKHMSGEYPTSSAMGLWLAVHLLRTGHIPQHMVKRPTAVPIRSVLLYNTYKGLQHGFILCKSL